MGPHEVREWARPREVRECGHISTGMEHYMRTVMSFYHKQSSIGLHDVTTMMDMASKEY